MQPRFERRVGNGPFTLVEQPRFRAGFDFLRLRAEVGEVDAALGRWWEEFSLADTDERRRLMDEARVREQGRRKTAKAAPRREAADAAAAPAEEDASPDDGEADMAAADPARKRRRRRRKPAGGRGEGESAGTPAVPPLPEH